MGKSITTTEDIYELAQDLLDGDEFQSDDAAERAMNVKYFALLAERDWYFLTKSSALTLANLALSEISDIDKVLAVRKVDVNGIPEQDPLRRAPFSDRYNTDYDYYIDYSSQEIVLINEITTGSLLVDYKKKPNPLALATAEGYDTVPVIPVFARPIIALRMVLDFKKSDEAIEMFKENGYDLSELEDLMVNDHTNYEEIYA